MHLREVEVAHRVLESQFSKVTDALSLQQDLMQALLDGERLTSVLRIVAARTEAAVVLFDTDFEVRASYPTNIETDVLVPIVREALRTEAPTGKGSIWTTLDQQSLAIRPVHVDGDVLGWLCMMTGAARAEDGVELSLTQASLACALHHLEEQAAARTRAALRDEVLLNLLGGATEERRAGGPPLLGGAAEQIQQHFVAQRGTGTCRGLLLEVVQRARQAPWASRARCRPRRGRCRVIMQSQPSTSPSTCTGRIARLCWSSIVQIEPLAVGVVVRGSSRDGGAEGVGVEGGVG